MSLEGVDFGLGTIKEIIRGLKSHYKVSSLDQLTEQQKLEALCFVLDFPPGQLDNLIADHSPVLRTIQGHAFEQFFDLLLRRNGYAVEKQGGDTATDRIVNGHTLQLKTPTKAGTSGSIVQYKTHKTHGAKSELESIDYYHSRSSFPDFLVGLVTYDPLQILVLDRDSLPGLPKNRDRILSPFTIDWTRDKGLNAFQLLGIKKLDTNVVQDLIDTRSSLLPHTSAKLGLHSTVIIDTILQEENFRIWDMNIRGFAREVALTALLLKSGIRPLSPTHCARSRADKADLALMVKRSQTCEHFQIKGPTLGASDFNARDAVLGIETQLSRGRANDHPTQSRLYLSTDFEGVIVCLEPLVSKRASKGGTLAKGWEFYAVPVSALSRHHKFANRIASMQHFRYSDLQKYRIDERWLRKWARQPGRSSRSL